MRIATLCGMGFGTSMMLKLTIDDVLRAEGIKAETYPWDLGSFKGNKVDIVVAPTDMEPHLRDHEAKVVYIRNLIDKKKSAKKYSPPSTKFNRATKPASFKEDVQTFTNRPSHPALPPHLSSCFVHAIRNQSHANL